MRGTSSGLIALAGLFLLAQSLGAQEARPEVPDISGKWELTREGGREGRGGGTSVMTIKQKGAEFTGTMELRFGAARIEKGKIDGSSISFVTLIQTPNGREFTQTYTGKIAEDGTMSGAVTGGPGGRGGGSWKAGRMAER